MVTIGYGYSKQEILNIANDYAISLGKKTEFDPTLKHSWYSRFLTRWPVIHLEKAEKLVIVHAKATSAEVLDKYFNELENVITKNYLQNRPDHIWNADESGITSKILYEKGSTPQGGTSSRGKNVTVIGCGNTAGNHVPPYFIFPQEEMDG